MRWGLQQIGGVLTAALTVRAAQPPIAAHGRPRDWAGLGRHLRRPAARAPQIQICKISVCYQYNLVSTTGDDAKLSTPHCPPLSNLAYTFMATVTPVANTTTVQLSWSERHDTPYPLSATATGDGGTGFEYQDGRPRWHVAYQIVRDGDDYWHCREPLGINSGGLTRTPPTDQTFEVEPVVAVHPENRFRAELQIVGDSSLPAAPTSSALIRVFGPSGLLVGLGKADSVTATFSDFPLYLETPGAPPHDEVGDPAQATQRVVIVYTTGADDASQYLCAVDVPLQPKAPDGQITRPAVLSLSTASDTADATLPSLTQAVVSSDWVGTAEEPYTDVVLGPVVDARGADVQYSLSDPSPQGVVLVTQGNSKVARFDAPGAHSVQLTATNDVGTTALTLEATLVTPAVQTVEDTPSLGVFVGDVAWQAQGAPQHGAATIEGGLLVYTPNPHYNGADTFSFARDGTVASFEATTSAIDDPPLLTPVRAAGAPGALVSVALGPATDVDGEGVTYELLDGPAHGSVTISGASASYTSAGGFKGTDAFVVSASDGITTVQTPVFVQVGGGGVTTLHSRSETTPVGQSLVVDLGYEFAIVSSPAQGSAEASGTQLTYSPPAAFQGDTILMWASTDHNHAGVVAVRVGAKSVSSALLGPAAQPALSARSRTVAYYGDGPTRIALSRRHGNHPVAFTLTSLGLPAGGELRAAGSGNALSVGDSIAGGEVDFLPPTGFSGAASFTYLARAARSLAAAEVSLVAADVPASNPTAVDGSEGLERVSADRSTTAIPVTLDRAGVEDGTFTVTAAPGNAVRHVGGLALGPDDAIVDGVVDFIPNYANDDGGRVSVLEYKVTDAGGLDHPRTVEFEVINVDPQVDAAQSFSAGGVRVDAEGSVVARPSTDISLVSDDQGDVAPTDVVEIQLTQITLGATAYLVTGAVATAQGGGAPAAAADAGIEIDGIGLNYSGANGFYNLTDTVHNGKAVYRKEVTTVFFNGSYELAYDGTMWKLYINSYNGAVMFYLEDGTTFVGTQLWKAASPNGVDKDLTISETGASGGAPSGARSANLNGLYLPTSTANEYARRDGGGRLTGGPGYWQLFDADGEAWGEGGWAANALQSDSLTVGGVQASTGVWYQTVSNQLVVQFSGAQGAEVRYRSKDAEGGISEEAVVSLSPFNQLPHAGSFELVVDPLALATYEGLPLYARDDASGLSFSLGNAAPASASISEAGVLTLQPLDLANDASLAVPYKAFESTTPSRFALGTVTVRTEIRDPADAEYTLLTAPDGTYANFTAWAASADDAELGPDHAQARVVGSGALEDLDHQGAQSRESLRATLRDVHRWPLALGTPSITSSVGQCSAVREATKVNDSVAALVLTGVPRVFRDAAGVDRVDASQMGWNSAAWGSAPQVQYFYGNTWVPTTAAIGGDVVVQLASGRRPTRWRARAEHTTISGLVDVAEFTISGYWATTPTVVPSDLVSCSLATLDAQNVNATVAVEAAYVLHADGTTRAIQTDLSDLNGDTNVGVAAAVLLQVAGPAHLVAPITPATALELTSTSSMIAYVRMRLSHDPSAHGQWSLAAPALTNQSFQGSGLVRTGSQLRGTSKTEDAELRAAAGTLSLFPDAALWPRSPESAPLVVPRQDLQPSLTVPYLADTPLDALPGPVWHSESNRLYVRKASSAADIALAVSRCASDASASSGARSALGLAANVGAADLLSATEAAAQSAIDGADGGDGLRASLNAVASDDGEPIFSLASPVALGALAPHLLEDEAHAVPEGAVVVSDADPAHPYDPYSPDVYSVRYSWVDDWSETSEGNRRSGYKDVEVVVWEVSVTGVAARASASSNFVAFSDLRIETAPAGVDLVGRNGYNVAYSNSQASFNGPKMPNILKRLFEQDAHVARISATLEHLSEGSPDLQVYAAHIPSSTTGDGSDDTEEGELGQGAMTNAERFAALRQRDGGKNIAVAAGQFNAQFKDIKAFNTNRKLTLLAFDDATGRGEETDVADEQYYVGQAFDSAETHSREARTGTFDMAMPGGDDQIALITSLRAPAATDLPVDFVQSFAQHATLANVYTVQSSQRQRLASVLAPGRSLPKQSGAASLHFDRAGSMRTAGATHGSHMHDLRVVSANGTHYALCVCSMIADSRDKTTLYLHANQVYDITSGVAGGTQVTPYAGMLGAVSFVGLQPMPVLVHSVQVTVDGVAGPIVEVAERHADGKTVMTEGAAPWYDGPRVYDGRALSIQVDETVAHLKITA